jgi:hypothetical protein
VSTATAPASAREALDMVRAGLGYLTATDPAALGTETQAQVLDELEQDDAALTAARAWFLAAFTSGQGYCAAADYSPRAWLMHHTGITRGAAAAHTAWSRRTDGHLGGPMVFVGFGVPLFHLIGWLGVVIGALRGAYCGDAYNKWQATKDAPARSDRVTVIPLDVIAGVRATKSQGITGWWGFQTLVVTTTDGTEYGFRGKMDNWQAYLTSALALRGREVRGTVEGITITPWKACTEG